MCGTIADRKNTALLLRSQTNHSHAMHSVVIVREQIVRNHSQQLKKAQTKCGLDFQQNYCHVQGVRAFSIPETGLMVLFVSKVAGRRVEKPDNVDVLSPLS
jgi:hypothetical protein